MKNVPHRIAALAVHASSLSPIGFARQKRPKHIATRLQGVSLRPRYGSVFSRSPVTLAAIVALAVVSTLQGLTLHHYTNPPYYDCAADYYSSFTWHASGSGFVPGSPHSWSIPGWVYGGANADGNGNIEVDFWLSWCCYGGRNGTDIAPLWLDGVQVGTAEVIDNDNIAGQCPGAVGVNYGDYVSIVMLTPSTPTPTPTPAPTPDDKNHKTSDGQGGGNGQDGNDDNGPRHAGNDCGRSHGMARYTVDLSTVSLKITDTPVEYTPPRGPKIDFVIAYSQRDPDQSPAQAYSNLGPNWTFNWLSYVTDDPANPSADASIYVRGGGTEVYAGFDVGTQSYAPDVQSQAVLVRTSSNTYEKRLPDGSKFVYSQSDGALSYPRLIFLTQVIDPTGNAATLHYYGDGTNRLDYIADALGQTTTFSYENSTDPNKITKVTDPFGRYAVLNYTNGQLTSSTDPVGIVSQFGYASGTNFINSLITPYGEATFETGESGTDRWLNLTDPTGGMERVEYRDNAPGIAASDPANTVPAISGIGNANLDVRNTFYWSKKALATYPPVDGVYDYTKATIYHWLLSADGASVSPIVSSEKMPLENRVWHTYLGQADSEHAGPMGNPSQTARVLGDGTTQLYQYEYNALGNVTKITDPLGRVTSNAYDANEIDLLSVYQRNPAGASTDPDGQNADLISSYTYNSQHEPLTATDSAGQATVRTYTPEGQLWTVTNARNEQTTYTYGGTVPAGYLETVTGPVFNGASAVTHYSYDSDNRVHSVTDSDGYTITTDYDNLDRKSTVTFPDGSYQQFQYTDNVTAAMTLDVTGSKDRRGYWTYRHYDGNQHMDLLTDAENRMTHYSWCACGELESITDPQNQITTFHRDIQGRVYEKIFNDNTSISYLFEGQSGPNTAGATSRMQSATDAKGQRTHYTYFADDNIAQVTYTDTTGLPLSPPTPSVSYTYDPVYNRQATMVDGSGTSTFTYNPVTVPTTLGANQLASIDGPISNDTISFSYDELGRVNNRQINGSANSETWSYDSLGRLSSDANKLGTFNYTYDGVTSRLLTLAYPNGITASYTYFPNLQDKRLEEIKNQTSPSVLLSQFDYTYDSEGQLQTWTKSYPGLAIPQRYDLGYDHTDQLLTAPLRKTSNNSLVRQFTYVYDDASNRTSEQVGSNITSSTPNGVNEITSQSGATNRTLTYDLNGNLTDDGATRTFEWDAANRLVAINYTGTNLRTEFSYDGLNRCVTLVEKNGNTTTSTRRFVWCGNDRCEFRGVGGAVQVQLYAQGQYQSAAPYYYTRDHLGSIREMTDASGTVVARYDYDPYGRSNTLIGTNKPDFNFTGLYNHAKSGLDMAVRRFYDPDLGRWLNRDPSGEQSGLNLYGYGENNPVDATDLSGLDPHTITVQSFIPAPTIWGFRGDGHGSTSTPANSFRTSSTISFDDSVAGYSVHSTTGTSSFLGILNGQASPVNLNGEATIIAAGIARVHLDGSASDPIVPHAPPASYDISLSLNFNTGVVGGSINRTDFPSFQMFLDGVNVYNHEAIGGPLNLYDQTTDVITLLLCR